MKRVLITGGAGFIGYHLAKRMSEAGYQIDIADNFSRGLVDQALRGLVESKKVNLINANLLEQEGYRKLANDYTLVFHLAALLGVANVQAMPYAVLTDNMTMLTQLLSWARELKSLQRIVFTSTSEVYAGTLRYFGMAVPTPEETPLTVSDLSEPRTSYMLSKIYGEAVCLHSGLPVTLVRPHNIYGPRMGLSHVVPELLKKMREAKPGSAIEIFSPQHTRTFCYVSDAVEMLVRLAEAKEAKQQAFNIGCQEPEIPIYALAQLLLRISNRSDLSLKEMPDTAGSPSRRCPSMLKTYQVTQYSPQYSLERGVEETYKWYKEWVFEGGEKSAV